MTEILIIITIIIIMILIYVICYSKLKEINIKISYTDELIKSTLEKKSDIITKINNEIKKKMDKKNYLKDYINLSKKNITSIELDIKLNEGLTIIKNLKEDLPEIKTKEFKKLVNELNRNEEMLVSSKILFNKYATSLNQLLRKFPYNICSKFTKIHIRPYYNLTKKLSVLVDYFFLTLASITLSLLFSFCSNELISSSA